MVIDLLDLPIFSPATVLCGIIIMGMSYCYTVCCIEKFSKYSQCIRDCSYEVLYLRASTTSPDGLT